MSEALEKTPVMSKAIQLYIAIMLALPKDHEMYPADWTVKDSREFKEIKGVTKENVFSVAENGKSFFEYSEGWRHAEVIHEFLRDSGEKVTLEDFKKEIVEGKSLFDLAAEQSSFHKLLAPDVFVGHYDEINDIVFSYDKSKRGHVVINEFKKRVALLEGRETREILLEKMGIRPKEMHDAIKSGNTVSVSKKLKEAGDHLRKEDFFILDSDGKHPLVVEVEGTVVAHQKPKLDGWKNFLNLQAELEEHGEILDAEFFLFGGFGGSPTILEAAIGDGMGDKIFNARVFSGRPEEAIKLYEHVPADKKDKIDIDKVVADIIEGMYAQKFSLDGSLTVDRLTEVINGDQSGKDNFFAIRGLGLKSVWAHMEEIRGNLKAKGDALTMDHLRLRSGYDETTCLMIAVEAGQLEQVIQIMAENHADITAEDFLEKGADGKTLTQILIDNDRVDFIFQPYFWAGKQQELTEVWKSFPEKLKIDYREDYDALRSRVNIISLRRLSSSFNAGVSDSKDEDVSNKKEEDKTSVIPLLPGPK